MRRISTALKETLNDYKTHNTVIYGTCDPIMGKSAPYVRKERVIQAFRSTYEHLACLYGKYPDYIVFSNNEFDYRATWNNALNESSIIHKGNDFMNVFRHIFQNNGWGPEERKYFYNYVEQQIRVHATHASQYLQAHSQAHSHLHSHTRDWCHASRSNNVQYVDCVSDVGCVHHIHNIDDDELDFETLDYILDSMDEIME